MNVLKIKLSGENLKLSKFEVETLFSVSVRLWGNTATLKTKLSEAAIRKICENSAMIKRACLNEREIWRVNRGRFLEREPQKKLKFHPAMLKPKLARVLINISKAQKTLLDPFCGTGSILIEAAVLGLTATGSDIDRKQIWYSKKNLKQYNLKANLFEMDATQLKFKKKFDVIVTDPPYGRSSTLAGKKIAEVYSQFLAQAPKVLRPRGRVVFMHPKGLKFKIPIELKKVKVFDWYVHHSLTRRILVLEKI